MSDCVFDLDGLSKGRTDDDVVEYLVKLVMDGKVAFPYQRFFSLPPRTLFNNLKERDAPISTTYDRRLYSYYPKYGLYLPPEFRGEPLIILTNESSHSEIDVLSDIFVEDIRMKSRRLEEPYSVHDIWFGTTETSTIHPLNIPTQVSIDLMRRQKLTELMRGVMESDKSCITQEMLSHYIFKWIPSPKPFYPSWCKELVLQVLPNPSKKRWLDISAGWGDRLLTAMALDMDYIGYDPNIDLKKGHSEMIEMFGDPKRHRVIYEPFESAKVPVPRYDIVLSSPPFFDLEIYSDDPQQSVEKYPDFVKWLNEFLFKSISKAWAMINPDGYLMLYIGDTQKIQLCEPTNLYIETVLTPQASWEGVIGLQAMNGYPRPTWVWKKTKLGDTRKVWTSKKHSKARSLRELYPELYK